MPSHGHRSHHGETHYVNIKHTYINIQHITSTSKHIHQHQTHSSTSNKQGMNNLLVGDTWQMNLLGDTVRERKSVTVAPVTLGHQVTWILLKREFYLGIVEETVAQILCTLYLLVCQVRDTVSDSLLCSCDVFQAQIALSQATGSSSVHFKISRR